MTLPLTSIQMLQNAEHLPSLHGQTLGIWIEFHKFGI